MCGASRVGATVLLDELPLSPAYQRAAEADPDARPFDAALGGGEDYELLVAVPPGRVGRARAAARKLGVRLTVVGEATAERGVRVLGVDGRRYMVRAGGYDHLASTS